MDSTDWRTVTRVSALKPLQVAAWLYLRAVDKRDCG